MLNRFLAAALVGAGSLLGSSSAQAWHHHNHFYGAYGVGFYSPAAYAYSSPWYSSFSFTTGYWPRHRLFHRHHYPYIASYYRSAWFTPTYYSAYYPTYYAVPVYNPVCQPIVTQSYYLPSYDVPSVDCCSTIIDNSGVIPSSGAVQTGVSAPVDPQLQIRNQPRSQYLIADKAAWVDTAVELIDQMAASGGLAEAEQSCEHLISVRNNVPASIHLRAGLLALRNGKSLDVAATHLQQAAQLQDVESTVTELSSDFSTALHIDQYAQWEPHIQSASKRLLGDEVASTSKIRLTSERSDSRTSPQSAIQPDDNARVILDTLLRVSGQSVKADQISQAMERLPNL